MSVFPTIGDFINQLMNYPLETRLQIIALMILGFGISWYFASRIKMAKYRMNAYKAIELSKKLDVIKEFMNKYKGDVKLKHILTIKISSGLLSGFK